MQTTITWHDYQSDPPKGNGFFLIVTRPKYLDRDQTDIAADEAQRWIGCHDPDEPAGWFLSDEMTPIDEGEILYWAPMPTVPLPNLEVTGRDSGPVK